MVPSRRAWYLASFFPLQGWYECKSDLDRPEPPEPRCRKLAEDVLDKGLRVARRGSDPLYIHQLLTGRVEVPDVE